MATTQLAFPEPADLETDHIGDNKGVTFTRYTLSDPHPGFGKNPNILNEYGHTKYPKWVKNAANDSVIVNNAKEEAALLAMLPAKDNEKEMLREEVAKLKAEHEAVSAAIDHEKEALKAELAQLKESLANKKAASALRTDGPTVQEYVAAGLKAHDYPPKGYASKSTEEEVNALIEEQEEAEEASKPTGWNTSSPFDGTEGK